jgi:hydroxymethylpyrimidine/phosphomethylpyrimidine kinase
MAFTALLIQQYANVHGYMALTALLIQQYANVHGLDRITYSAIRECNAIISNIEL